MFDVGRSPYFERKPTTEYLKNSAAKGFKRKVNVAAGSIPFLIFMLEQSQSIRHLGVGGAGVVVNMGRIDEVPAILTMVD